MSTKRYTVYHIDDKSCPDGKMKKIDGPAITDALKQGKITQDDCWDCNEKKLIDRMIKKGVIK